MTIFSKKLLKILAKLVFFYQILCKINQILVINNYLPLSISFFFNCFISSFFVR